MKPPGSSESAFTVLEACIALVLIAILIALTLPSFSLKCPPPGSMIESLSNSRQLYNASFQMALDGTATGNTNIGWPGDMGGSFARWAQTLVTNEYLTTNDLAQFLSAPGKILPPGKIPTNNDAGILVYAVTNGAAGSVVFLTSANFTNTPAGGAPLQAKAKPYGDKGFVVFRMGGEGCIYRSTQVGQTNVIGGYAPLCR